MTKLLKVDQICVSKEGSVILDNISFETSPGELISIVGPSGCGKTTLVDTMMGFNHLGSGSITIEDKLLASADYSLDPGLRDFGAVFQNHNLFPHLNVRDNILYSIWHMDKAQQNQRLKELSELVELDDKLDRSISTLSGGERQRVAIARGLAPHPKILFLDEPFSSLDRLLRLEIRGFIKELLKKMGMSAFLVTHDKDDAFHFSDRVLLLNEGKLIQQGSPKELYENPVNDFVLDFFCSNIRSSDGVRSLSPYEVLLENKDFPKGRDVLIRDRYFIDGRYCYRLELVNNDRATKNHFNYYSFDKLNVGEYKKMVERRD
jgi:iron(III) transport system ATP-binding protein